MNKAKQMQVRSIYDWCYYGTSIYILAGQRSDEEMKG